MAIMEYGGPTRPLIVQNTRQMFKKRFPSVVRCIEEGRMNGKDILLVGCQDKKLHILDNDFNELQTIEFQQWVRCINSEYIKEIENSAVLIGCGDSTLRFFQVKEEKFQEVHQFNFGNFVNGCAIADIDDDGIPELIGGSWDKTIKVFDSNTFELKWAQEFPVEVDLIKVADFNYDGRLELGVILRGGSFQVLEGKKGLELWRYSCEQDLTCCDIHYFDFSGYPYIILSGNDQKIHFIDFKGQQIHQINTNDRITALAIGDIDGDERNEILIGSGSSKLLCYEMKQREIFSFDLKWKMNTNGVINTFLIQNITNENKRTIVFGGYDTFLSGIQDNYYEIKPKMGTTAMPLFICPKIPVIKPKISIETAIPIKPITPISSNAPTSVINKPETALFHIDNESGQNKPEESANILSSQINLPKTSADTRINTEIKEGNAPGTPIVTRQREFESSKQPESLSQQQSQTWEGQSMATISPSKPITSGMEVSNSESIQLSLNENPDIERALNALKPAGVISTKAKLIDILITSGISESNVESIIEILKEKEQLSYSNKAPRGYSLHEAGAPGTIATESIKTKAKKASKKTSTKKTTAKKTSSKKTTAKKSSSKKSTAKKTTRKKSSKKSSKTQD